MESRAEGYLPRNIYHVPLYLDTLIPSLGEIALPLTSARNSRNVSVNVSASLRQKIVAAESLRLHDIRRLAASSGRKEAANLCDDYSYILKIRLLVSLNLLKQ